MKFTLRVNRPHRLLIKRTPLSKRVWFSNLRLRVSSVEIVSRVNRAGERSETEFRQIALVN
jgi:hypothetical protein